MGKWKHVKTIEAVFLFSILCFNLTGCSQKKETSIIPQDQVEVSSIHQITEEANTQILMDNRPISSFWFPEQLLEWNAEEDKDFTYNISTIPLKKRVEREKLKAINSTQNKDTNVVAISIMNSNTSGNFPHGSSKFDANTFSYWQYIDKLVYWGGSSGEGLIVPPSPDVTDIAHKNGVSVLGTIFFPMLEHGGKIEWLDTFLKKDANGNFPITDKLIEVAKKYGFEGWFINQETQGTENSPLTETHASLMQEFIKQIKEKAEWLEIMWYDSMTKNGVISWQNALTDQNQFFLLDDKKEAVADSMFLNFWWSKNGTVEHNLLRDSKKRAIEVGIDPYNIYAGIDVQALGIGTPVRWELLEDGSPENTLTSIGLYCPSWTYSSAENLEDYEKKENALWVNEKGNPSVETEAKGAAWKGISTYVIERTIVNEIPFTTNFSMGNGYDFYIEGKKVSQRDWNNRSMADVMPTYRWIIDCEKENQLTAKTDFTDAYYGGNCFLFQGKMEKKSGATVKLFSSDLIIEKGVILSIVGKASTETKINAILELENGKKIVEGDKRIKGNWESIKFDISDLENRTVQGISLQIIPQENQEKYEFRLGQLSVWKEEESSTDIQTVKVEDAMFDEEAIFAGIRLSWESMGTGKVKNYEIYRINQNGTKSFLAASTNTCYYIDKLQRMDGSMMTELEVVAVERSGKRGNSARATIQWPDVDVPKADFKASATIIAPGDSITYQSTSSHNTEGVVWEFEGGDIKTSTEKNPTVVYSEEGTYTVTLTAKNQKGEAKEEKKAFITVTKKAKNGLVNLSEGKKTEASQYVNEKEAPWYAVDGTLEKKWCATGLPPHTLTIDLGEERIIGEVAIAHAEAGKESRDMNTQKYSIEVSTDGENYTKVVETDKNTEANTVDTFQAVKARYVKLIVEKPTQGSDTAARIYEIKVFGLQESVQ